MFPWRGEFRCASSIRRGWCSQFNLTGIGDRPSHLETLCWISSREQVCASAVSSLCVTCASSMSLVSHTLFIRYSMLLNSNKTIKFKAFNTLTQFPNFVIKGVVKRRFKKISSTPPPPTPGTEHALASL